MAFFSCKKVQPPGKTLSRSAEWNAKTKPKGENPNLF
jgi:hypothetical protein